LAHLQSLTQNSELKTLFCLLQIANCGILLRQLNPFLDELVTFFAHLFEGLKAEALGVAEGFADEDEASSKD